MAAKKNFTVEFWADFWKDPLAATGGETVLADDIVGHWPGEPEPVRGLRDYYARIQRLLTEMPTLRLELLSHATSGDAVFLHYLARGTGVDGPFESEGMDRLTVRDGLVVENLIRYDESAFTRALGRAC
ncbi:nuclear transport factor 2 family protein [Allokutzneria sp. A3M-2-11 16]|uniref:nuclear transport factor 2 family protein n=1 Tax=Allokutzneria sp. A3M-2-11 16 TaxID=2962043 RepID=UPI0020B65068|nr:nuclear transport factor 2 family protein [Allokutzneria sp. A3M-2-11 16]MCP3800461.1 nuclear transport factor 2 family protein [Allokutzneria sp. A3M-2-11 16]